MPYLDEVVRLIVPDLGTELTKFRAGESDIHGVLERSSKRWNQSNKPKISSFTNWGLVSARLSSRSIRTPSRMLKPVNPMYPLSS